MKIFYIKDKVSGDYTAYSPHFSCVTSQGRTKKEAKILLLEAIKLIP